MNEYASAGYFKKHFIASIIYALITVVCLYEVASGILMPLWVIATVAYGIASLKWNAFGIKKGTFAYGLAMILLGVSTVLTDNLIIIFFNYMAIFVLLLSMLLNNVYEDKKWNLGKLLLNFLILTFGSITMLDRPIVDGIAFARSRSENADSNKSHKVGYVLTGIMISVPFVIIVGFCLASADSIFGSLFNGLFSGVDFFTIASMGMMFIFTFIVTYCGLRYLAKRSLDESMSEVKKKEPIVAITFLAIMVAMYVVFSVIQVVYLFLGFGTLPEGITYASYARTGFFQLLFVCMVNVLMILVIKRHFAKSKILDGLMYLCSICTYIMIASSAYRMLLYIGAYSLTFLRILVLFVLAGLALILIGADVYIAKEDFPFFHYCTVVTTIVYIAFSLIRVDYVIADYNLSHSDLPQDVWMYGGEEGVVDVDYIAELSADAAPVIMKYVGDVSDINTSDEDYMDYRDDARLYMYLKYYESIEYRLDKRFRHLNISRYNAQKVL